MGETRWKLTLEYDGTDFHGWSIQPNGRTVQGELEVALAQLLRHEVQVAGSGRTDAGVHAAGQVAAFTTSAERTPDNILRGLNAMLPGDLAVVRAERVHLGFDPRHDAKVKHYRYRWLDRQARSPLRRRDAWWVRDPLDVEAMQAAVQPLMGTHDFSSFRAAGCDAAHPVRTVQRLAVSRRGGEVHLDAHGHGFLRYMVRNIAGSLWVIGLRRRPPEWLAEVLAARDRGVAARTAPALGLTLLSVQYGEEREGPQGEDHTSAR
ncbi:MAG: tRNA pseudouridine(38-40) synthase TruA [Deltaproteobacteria bacterium]|nr:tRNA pseudouridine(38-40) synthase TruA [Deltaproteobacteria bacterium]